MRDEIGTAVPEIAELTRLIETERGKLGQKRAGQGGMRQAIEATEHIQSRKLALRIAYECLKVRGYKDINGQRKIPSALSVIVDINTCHKGPKSVGAWLLYLAHEAGLINQFRSPRHRVHAQITSLLSQSILETLFREIEQELQPNRVHTKPLARPARIRQNRLSPPDGVRSRGSDTTKAAARAVHQTAWRVNSYMLGVLDRCGLPDVRPIERELEQIRAERDSLFASRKELLEQLEDDPDVAAAAEREYSDAIAVQHHVRGLESKLAEHAADKQTLAAARAREKFPEFYIPVRFDYRGRLYQIASQLQYTGGSDLSRGLLEFAHGVRVADLDKLPRTDEVLTPKKVASMYLKIHIANCWGVRGGHDKREEWVTENIDGMRRSVDDPVTYDWWRQAKEPYQFLAAAHAFIETFKNDELFKNNDAELHIPVTLDATNSGLQHCCLLLRDKQLAPLVNMVDQYVPQDFYEVIGAQTKLERRSAKEIIVPLIYGSAASNTAGILAGGKQFTKGDYARAVKIRETIWSEIPDVQALYKWLEQIARITAKAGKALTWITPSGFTVAQDSRKVEKRVMIDVVLPTGRFQAKGVFPTQELNPRKQASSFAANFVHSYDASLLALLVESGAAVGIRDWACAHDSIGVPAWHGWDLLKLAGNAMHSMHTPDNLGAAWAHWRELGVELPDPPGIRVDGLPTPINAGNFYLWM